jgi:hypothetical protein
MKVQGRGGNEKSKKNGVERKNRQKKCVRKKRYNIFAK